MWLLLESVFFPNEMIKYVTIFRDENLTPQVTILSSSCNVVMNEIQWFILVTSKEHISTELHKFGDLCRTLGNVDGISAHV